MERYGNLGGDSAVVAYEIGERSIAVEFRSGSVYLYTYDSAGSHYIEEMKKLAMAGRGLGTFITTVVRKNYASKVR
jgi:hypothetical protein